MADKDPRKRCSPTQETQASGNQQQETERKQANTGVTQNETRQMVQARPETQVSLDMASQLTQLTLESKSAQICSTGSVNVPGDYNPSFHAPVSGTVNIHYNVTANPKDAPPNQVPEIPGCSSTEPCTQGPSPSTQDTSQPFKRHHQVPERVVTYAEMHTAANSCEAALKSHYKSTGSYVQMIPWVDDDTKHIMDIYTTLLLESMGEGVVCSRLELESYQDIFFFKTKEGDAIKRAILNGLAGRGKSTLVDKMAYDWAAFSQALRMFKLVFVLKMCALEHNSELIDAIFDQLLDHDTKIDRLALKEFIHSYPNGILVLLDGFDEFTMSTAKICPESVLGIINRKICRECWVVVTTRPSHINSLMSKQLIQDPFTHVLVSGFSSDNIQEYVTRFFSTEPVSAVGLVEKIQSSGVSSDLAKSPMLLLLMCLLWRNNGSLPETTTRLYDQAIQYVFRRKADMSPEEMSDVVIALGKVALVGLLSPDQLLCFGERDFEKSALDAAVKVGILTKQREIGQGLKVYNSIQFIHKTIQEYCAAKYLHTLSEDEFQKTFDKVDRLDEYEYLLRFCCGDNDACSQIILRMLERCFFTEQKEAYAPVSKMLSREQHETRRTKLALSCCLESQSKTLPPVDFVSSVLTTEISLSDWDRDSLHAFSFVMESVAISTKKETKPYLAKVQSVNLQSCKVGKFCEDLEHSAGAMTNLEQVNLVRCSLTATNVSNVASSLSQATTLTKLDLSHNKTLSGSANLWSPSLTHLKSLKSLTLKYCSLMPEDWRQVLLSLSELPGLIELDLSSNNEMQCSGNICFTHLRYCKCLQRLDVSNCSLGGTDVTQIFTSVSYLTGLVEINLSLNESISGSASQWSNQLEDCKHLKKLNLKHCSLTGGDLMQVAASLRKIPNLMELYLSSPDVEGDPVAPRCYLEQMKPLHKFDIHCRITSASVLKHVIELLSSATNLVELNLIFSYQLENSMAVWCPHLKQLKNLRRLTFDEYRSELQDLSHLALAVGQMPNIQECVISHEYGVFDFITNTLLSETNLVAITNGGIILNLSGCSLSGEAIDTILETMTKRGDLIEMNLSGSTLTGYKAVWYKHLKNLKLLRKLVLRHCSLNSQDVKEIREALGAGSLVEVDLSQNE
ncbi:NLR family CARD domain-containing protein 4-like [Patiria miniata]|uniref:NACHT domain-containing protein n=1 Tax=Patiria miniata TaxID=46514 RepID=A0A914AFG7_PATMI|nr:NLR family CARD domain-containing protein 4-like [Patiria miniata]